MPRISTNLGLALLASCTLVSSVALLGRSPTTAHAQPARQTLRPNHIIVPNVFRMSEKQAIAALRRAGFTGRITYSSNACGSVVEGKVIELGQVCYQHPVGGRSHHVRIPVSLTIQRENPRRGAIGKNTEWRLFPNLVGMHLDQAKKALRAAGFPITGTTSWSPRVIVGCKPNHVCRTYPSGLQRHSLRSTRAILYGATPPK